MLKKVMAALLAIAVMVPTVAEAKFRGGGFSSIRTVRVAPKVTPPKPPVSKPAPTSKKPVVVNRGTDTPVPSSGSSLIPFVAGALVGSVMTSDQSQAATEPQLECTTKQTKDNKCSTQKQ